MCYDDIVTLRVRGRDRKQRERLDVNAFDLQREQDLDSNRLSTFDKLLPLTTPLTNCPMNFPFIILLVNKGDNWRSA